MLYPSTPYSSAICTTVTLMPGNKSRVCSRMREVRTGRVILALTCGAAANFPASSLSGLKLVQEIDKLDLVI